MNPFRLNEVIVTYYVFPCYKNLPVGTRTRRPGYCEGNIAIEAEHFAKLYEKLKQGMGYSHTVWIYRVRICAMPLIKDACYKDDEEGRKQDEERKTMPDLYRKNNVVFYDSYKTGNDAPLMQKLSVLRIKSTKNINEGNEMWLYYVKNYDWFNVWGFIVRFSSFGLHYLCKS